VPWTVGVAQTMCRATFASTDPAAVGNTIRDKCRWASTTQALGR
jgi:hypothetical protein